MPQQSGRGVGLRERAIGPAGRASGSVLDTVRRLPLEVPALIARGAAALGRTSEAVISRAQRLPAAVPMVRQAVRPILTGRVDDWRAEYAYTAGVQAFIYGFPYIYNAQIRRDWVTRPRNPALVPYAAVNQFWHASQLMDETYRDGGCPNNDTLYSVAWLDLSDGPLVLSHPDMGDRYFTFELVGFTSNNFDYVGQRTTGNKAADFAIVGPDWRGRLPSGIRAVTPAPTPWALVLGRTLINGTADVPNARELQAQYRLAPLGGETRATVPDRRDVYAPGDVATDPLAPWKTINAMLAENPPPPQHTVLLDQLARIGVGPGLDVEAQPDVVKQGLMRAAAVGMALLKQQFLSGAWANLVNGWRYPPPEMGRFGDDFLRRAADQSLAGIAANDPAEAVYLVNYDDADGNKLSAGNRYELRFDADTLPPVEGFWSLTAYTEADLNLIPNPVHRYSIGDRTPGLIRDRDGGLTIYLQPQSPGAEHERNWLPTSADNAWFVILRMYLPGPEVVSDEWECPGLTRVT